MDKVENNLIASHRSQNYNPTFLLYFKDVGDSDICIRINTLCGYSGASILWVLSYFLFPLSIFQTA